jgi:anionic cell wall polymer biosynthesis LytR-Cps2A-Psr (LCP) family protein
MRKLSLLKIAFIIVGILLVATIFYRIYQVKSFQKDLRPVTEEEKQKIISILSANMNITGSEVIFGNVIMNAHGTLVQVEVKERNFKKSYLINLDKNSLVRKYNEK